MLVIAGGEPGAIAACGDLFATFATQAFPVGPWGSGARMKLIVNLVLGLNRAVLAEGLALARACGLDPAAALEILRAGPAYSRVMDTKGTKMLSGDFTPEARLAQHLKDVHLILTMAQAARPGSRSRPCIATCSSGLPLPAIVTPTIVRSSGHSQRSRDHTPRWIEVEENTDVPPITPARTGRDRRPGARRRRRGPDPGARGLRRNPGPIPRPKSTSRSRTPTQRSGSRSSRASHARSTPSAARSSRRSDWCPEWRSPISVRAPACSPCCSPSVSDRRGRFMPSISHPRSSSTLPSSRRSAAWSRSRSSRERRNRSICLKEWSTWRS